VIKSKTMRWEGHVASMRDRRGAQMVLVERQNRKRPLERSRYRGEDNIKMDHEEER